MALVSLTTVSAFQSVGAISVVAMLIVSPNTAYLLTDRLSALIALSVLLSVISAIFGYALDGSVAGAMSVVSGILFLVAAVFSPSHGYLGRWLAQQRTQKAYLQRTE